MKSNIKNWFLALSTSKTNPCVCSNLFCLSVCLYVYLSIFLSICSISDFLSLFVCLFVCKSDFVFSRTFLPVLLKATPFMISLINSRLGNSFLLCWRSAERELNMYTFVRSFVSLSVCLFVCSFVSLFSVLLFVYEFIHLFVCS
jgi:hypothetical protein